MSDLKAVLPHCIGGLFAVFFAILAVALIGNAHSSAFKVVMTGVAFGIGLFGYVAGVWTAYVRGGLDELRGFIRQKQRFSDHMRQLDAEIEQELYRQEQIH